MLVTGGDDGGDSQNDDYDEMACDSDQEEALLAEVEAQKQGSNLSKDDELFLNKKDFVGMYCLSQISAAFTYSMSIQVITKCMH